MKEVAAEALWYLAVNHHENQDAIRGAGGIKPLMAMSKSGTDGQKAYSSGALESIMQSRERERAAKEKAAKEKEEKIRQLKEAREAKEAKAREAAQSRRRASLARMEARRSSLAINSDQALQA
jgi:hypothetical protein